MRSAGASRSSHKMQRSSHTRGHVADDQVQVARRPTKPQSSQAAFFRFDPLWLRQRELVQERLPQHDADASSGSRAARPPSPRTRKLLVPESSAGRDVRLGEQHEIAAAEELLHKPPLSRIACSPRTEETLSVPGHALVIADIRTRDVQERRRRGHES